MIKEKIGLIGVGNMGASILEGALRNRMIKPAQVLVYDRFSEKASAFAKAWKVRAARSVCDLAEKADVIVLAVKPQDLEQLVSEMKSSVRAGHIWVSILAGVKIKKIKTMIGMKAKVIRAMPNLGAKVAQSVTAVTGTPGKPLQLAKKIFSGCGKTLVLQEKHFDLVTAVSGSGPAYFFFLMEMLIESAVKQGLSAKEARILAVETAAASGRLAQVSAFSPKELRQMVTSKKGTTEAALKVLEKAGVSAILHRAVQAAVRRGRELSRGH
ncbi:MAG: pyrroline-5-carboxylate reductase [Candidatus Omnitrophica bacterium]|nr:pyrroline-5-carboxylate reductase [Candidatus Omnitrophota bacterium]